MENQLNYKNLIVLVPFPFDDFSGTKLRPALCLTNKIGQFEHIIISFISSRIPNYQNLLDSDLIINQANSDFHATGLRTDSVIRLHKLVTIPKHMIRRRLGNIDSNLQELIKNKLQDLFSS
jgi:mRNA interferase MazF